MTPELTRPFLVEKLSDGTRVQVDADPGERAAVAERLGLPAIAHLTCGFTLRRVTAGVLAARGHLHARVTYLCVITLEPFDSLIDEKFTVRFVPEGQETDDLELDAEDEIPYAGGAIDLGEATAEQLALALDPFPRKPAAELPAAARDAAGPFAALARLKGGRA
jgi:uncharacterized metal-binding protein YceD (DUF177 family)